jgi:hypothetical protein
MADFATLRHRRLQHWDQTPKTRINGPDAAASLLKRLGVVTLFPVSPEVPNFYHAYMGDPDAPTDSRHDSPSGDVYTWRWTLGRREAGFYTAIVRNRPTWVQWDLAAAALRLRGDLRPIEAIYQAGDISDNALRIAHVLEAAGGTLRTGELRKEAGFPTGKAERAAYLKAVDELDTRLLLAKVFSASDDDMGHALVKVRYPEHVATAEKLSMMEALEQFLLRYLPNAVYAVPGVLARHIGVAEPILRQGIQRIERTGRAVEVAIEGHPTPCYAWAEQ